MVDHLFGCWMTAQVLDVSMTRPLYDARNVLNGWDEAKVRRVERYLHRIATLSKSHEGAVLLERKYSQWKRRGRFLFAKLSLAEMLAVHILRLVAEGNSEGAKELHAQLRELLGVKRGEKAVYLREAPRLNRGAKVLAGAERGHEKKYGTLKQKEELRKTYRETLLKAQKDHPSWGTEALLQDVAEKHGVAKKTIRRNLKAIGFDFENFRKERENI